MPEEAKRIEQGVSSSDGKLKVYAITASGTAPLFHQQTPVVPDQQIADPDIDKKVKDFFAKHIHEIDRTNDGRRTLNIEALVVVNNDGTARILTSSGGTYLEHNSQVIKTPFDQTFNLDGAKSQKVQNLDFPFVRPSVDSDGQKISVTPQQADALQKFLNSGMNQLTSIEEVKDPHMAAALEQFKTGKGGQYASAPFKPTNADKSTQLG